MLTRILILGNIFMLVINGVTQWNPMNLLWIILTQNEFFSLFLAILSHMINILKHTTENPILELNSLTITNYYRIINSPKKIKMNYDNNFIK